ncbi:MAG TPA: SRPBCC family protein [Longimicrobiales bacterium]|nr:SRPBCC family protein [Longimicrobiales bacterium]
MTGPIRETVTVPVAVDRAFEHFVRHLGTWWPREYTWSQDVLEEIGVEPRKDGRCYEIGPHGFRCDWGRIVAWDPPHRLVFLWQIGPDRTPQPDPARASEVDVRFVETGTDATRVELEHRDFGRHGRDSDAYRDGLAAPQGWPYILERFTGSVQ